MYAETGLFSPHLQGSPQDLHPLQEELLCLLQAHDAPHLFDGGGRNLEQNATISDYSLGEGGDLFKAPEPIIEVPLIEFDPVTAAICMFSNEDDAITAEAIKVVRVDPIQRELLNEVPYDCKDIVARGATENTICELSDGKILVQQTEGEEEKTTQKDAVVVDGSLQKSISSGCLTSLAQNDGSSVRQKILNIHGMDPGSISGMRRTYSEGDIKDFGNGHIIHVNPNTVYPAFERLFNAVGDRKIEERRQKISRYRKKKTERNFGKKIKYACRKALADSQPRVRGRFVKVEECETSK